MTYLPLEKRSLLTLFFLGFLLISLSAQYSASTQAVLDRFVLQTWQNPAVGLQETDIQRAITETQGRDRFKATFLWASFHAYHENTQLAFASLMDCLDIGKSLAISPDSLALISYTLADMFIREGETALAELLLLDVVNMSSPAKAIHWLAKLKRFALFPQAESLKKMERVLKQEAQELLSPEDYERVLLSYAAALQNELARDFYLEYFDFFKQAKNPVTRLFFAESASMQLRKFSVFDRIPAYINLGKNAYAAIQKKETDHHIKYWSLLSIECRLQDDYIGAHQVAVQACLAVGIDTSLAFSLRVANVSENYAISLLSNLATTYLYLGMDGVERAFAITERLATQITEKANRLTDWNIASHHYIKSRIAVDRLLHIADYMWYERQDLSYLNRTLPYLDIPKGAVVYDQSFRQLAMAQPGPLADLLKQDNALAQQIYQLQRLPDQQAQLGKIALLLQQRSGLQADLLTRHPAYFQQKGHIPADFIQQQQQKLREYERAGHPTSILYFFHHHKFSYKILINTDTTIFARVYAPVLHPNNFPALVKSFPNCVQQSPLHRPLNEQQACIAEGYALSQLLLGEEIETLLAPRVLITGNGPFAAFPFQALPLDSLGQQYFGSKHTISIASSLRLHQLMEDRNVSPKKAGVLGFAPDFSADFDTLLLAERQQRNLGALFANKKELAAIADRVGGRYFYGEDAQIDHFYRYASQYSILHLATHAKADANDGRNSLFLLADPDEGVAPIFAEDLTQLSLQSNLVILSACETGLGSSHSTEGTIGFTHAFMAAGAKSLIASFWSVEDQSTAEVMTAFYKHLANGLPKDEALRQAQLDFRQRNQGTYRDHPYYWAAFSFFGDASPIQLPAPNEQRRYLVLGLLLITWLGIRSWRRHRSLAKR